MATKVSTLPRTTLVPFDGKIIFRDNVRTEATMQIPQMVASLRRNGFKANHPLVLSVQANGDMLVLCGNRRGLGLTWLRENDSAVLATILPGGKVPAVVYENLTEQEEVILRIDHGSDEDRVALDSWGEFLAIRQLVKAGMDSQEKIAEKMGKFLTTGKNAGKPNRSYIQPRTNLAHLPQFVQDEYERYCLDNDSSRVRWSDVSKLFKCYNEEFTQFPNGDGPNFTELWNSIVNPPESTTPVVADGALVAKELSVADAKKRAQVVSSPIVRDILLSSTGQSAAKLTELDARVVSAVADQQTLANIRAYLGDTDYAQLVANANGFVAAQNAESAGGAAGTVGAESAAVTV